MLILIQVLVEVLEFFHGYLNSSALLKVAVNVKTLEDVNLLVTFAAVAKSMEAAANIK